jgi:hypothetical protein
MKFWAVFVITGLVACTAESLPSEYDGEETTYVVDDDDPPPAEDVAEDEASGMCGIYSSPELKSDFGGLTHTIEVPVLCDPSVRYEGYPPPDKEHSFDLYMMPLSEQSEF